MHYKVSYSDPCSQYIPIEATFDTTSLKELNVQFPAWRPGRYELGNFAKNISFFVAKNESGKSIPYKKTSKDSWSIDCVDSEKITISYKYYSAELNAGSTFMDDLQLYVNPINCFIYDPSNQNEACTVELVIPSDFELACGAKHDGKTITCQDYHELVDSPFIASASLQHKTYEVLGKTFHLWFQGETKLDWPRLIDNFEKFTTAQIKKFSSNNLKHISFPSEDFHFLFQILPIKAYHGVEHTTSTVIALGPSEDIMGSLYDELLGVSSHELYHVWNIKTIRPKEMYPYDYSKENYSNLGYIAEGVTTYFGDLFLLYSGVKDFSWYKLELEKLLQKHFTNFGRFNYSVAQSSWDTWLDGYTMGAPNRKVSIYNEGALLAFAMDIKIRNGSNNNSSLHDVMKDLNINFALKNKGYTEEDYKELCERRAKTNLSDFFTRYVHGVDPYESLIVEALGNIGFDLEMNPNPKFDQRILGTRTEITPDKKTKVLQLWPGSPAEMGGVILGDIIESINDKEVNQNISELLETLTEQSLHIKVNRMGRKLELLCPNTNRNYFPIYSIKKQEIPTNLNCRIFKSWTGLDWDDI